VGFDPQQTPSCVDDGPRLRLKNAVNLLAAESVDWGVTPTRWQASLYPSHIRRRMTVLHEGIDTAVASPGDVRFAVDGLDRPLTNDDEVITYLSRSLEPYRGFHVFMRALPEILRKRPRAHVLIVGGDGVSYGPPAPAGTTYRQMMLDELAGQIDLSRVHFLGKVTHARFIEMLRVSSVHVYLSYPFVLSWSFLEAMSAGCLIIAASTAATREVIRDRSNGLLVDFFDQAGISRRIETALAHPERGLALREQARKTVLNRFDLRTVALPRYLALIDTLVNGHDPREI